MKCSRECKEIGFLFVSSIMLSTTREIHSFFLDLRRSRRCCLHCEKALFNVLQNNLKSFLYYFFACSFVRSFRCAPLCFSAYNFSSLFTYIYFSVSLFVFLWSLLYTWTTYKTNANFGNVFEFVAQQVFVCIANVQTFMLFSCFLSFIGCLARLGSARLSFFYFSCIPLLNSTFSHFEMFSLTLAHSLSYYFDSSFLSILTVKRISLSLLFIYFGIVNAGTILFCASTEAFVVNVSW